MHRRVSDGDCDCRVGSRRDGSILRRRSCGSAGSGFARRSAQQRQIVRRTPRWCRSLVGCGIARAMPRLPRVPSAIHGLHPLSPTGTDAALLGTDAHAAREPSGRGAVRHHLVRERPLTSSTTVDRPSGAQPPREAAHAPRSRLAVAAANSPGRRGRAWQPASALTDAAASPDRTRPSVAQPSTTHRTSIGRCVSGTRAGRRDRGRGYWSRRVFWALSVVAIPRSST
jgi:hypothetical protein